jgi:hypothetical protein
MLALATILQSKGYGAQFCTIQSFHVSIPTYQFCTSYDGRPRFGIWASWVEGTPRKAEMSFDASTLNWALGAIVALQVWLVREILALSCLVLAVPWLSVRCPLTAGAASSRARERM